MEEDDIQKDRWMRQYEAETGEPSLLEFEGWDGDMLQEYSPSYVRWLTEKLENMCKIVLDSLHIS